MKLDKNAYVKAAIGRTSMKGQVVERLREMVIFQQIPQGMRISEDELAKLFKVSKTPIREAVNVLRSEGLFTGQPWQGLHVVKLTRKDVKDIYSLRLLLEVEAMRQAMDLFTEEHATSVQRYKSAFEEVRAKDDDKGYVLLDTDFHIYIGRMTQNNWLVDILNRLRNISMMFRAFTRDKLKNRIIQDEHIPMIEAMLAGDSLSAVELMRRHIKRSWDDALATVPQEPTEEIR